MEIQFLGATKTVTGSKYLLKADKKVLVDCGLFQGLKKLRLRNWDALPIASNEIDAVILTHAHIDHTGYLPLLVKKGFRGKIYGTHLTIELCKVLLLDSGHLQEEEAYRANKFGYSKHKPALPLYTRLDAKEVFSHFEAISFHKDFDIGEFKFHFKRAGHIIGAATLRVKHKSGSILFSGDLGHDKDPCVLPLEDIHYADYIVLESTYGDRLHKNIDPEEVLGKIIINTVKKGGTLIIPAFAVGRTQNILYYIHNLKKEGKIPDIPIFLDSPMAQSITDIMLENFNEHLLDKKTCIDISEGVRYVRTVEESKKIDGYAYPKIIVSASGMASGGRVLHHIKAFAGDEKNVILFVGFQAAGTRGEALLGGKKEIKMFGKHVTVNAKVISLSNVSAHADYEEILAWLGKIKKSPRKIFITHGEEKASKALKTKIEEVFGWECIIPDYLQVEEL